jgi:hypothetical protein
MLEVELEFFHRVAGEMDELGPSCGVEKLEQGAHTEPIAIQALVPEGLETEDIAPTIKASHVHHYRLGSGRDQWGSYASNFQTRGLPG